jgi:phosphate transport system permease protein
MHAPVNPFVLQKSRARQLEAVSFWGFRFATYFVLLCATVIFATILWKGVPVVFQTAPPFVNLPFLLESPETLNVFELNGTKYELGNQKFLAFKAQNEDALKDVVISTYSYSAGGIFPCIVGTILLVVGSMTIALILGVCSAIYLSEYSKQGRFIHVVRLSILNLAGVPSIVFGLFGVGLFVVGFKFLGVQFFGWNISLLAGWFTLAFMVLPVVITASEESLKAVPKGFREGSLALGATQWQTIRQNVLPYALPGILTSSVLGIARVAGETAPIMFTAAYVMRDELPWQVKHFTDFFFQGVMALPYHIYVVSSKIPQNEYTERVQYGTAFVFLLVVMLIALTSIILRVRMRSRYRW